MADDKNVTDQEEEIVEEVDDGEAAFNETEEAEAETDAKAAESDKDGDDKDKDKDKDKAGDEDLDKDKDADKDNAGDEDKDLDKSGDGKDKKDKDKISDTQKRLDERIKTVDDEDIDNNKAKEEKAKEDKALEDKAKEDKDLESKAKDQDLDVSAIIKDLDLSNILSDDDLSEELKEYSKEYPEDFKAIKELSGGMAKNISSAIVPKLVEKMIESGEYVKASDVQEQFGKMNGQISQMSFDSNVSRRTDEDGNLKHSDYHHIVYGEGRPDFVDWLGKQPKKVQALGNSLDPDDGDLLLDNYKEESAKKKTAKHDKNQADKKKEHDDIHKSKKNNKTNQTTVSWQSDDPAKEAEDAFNEKD